MKPATRGGRLLLGALLFAALSAGVWIRDRAFPPGTQFVAAAASRAERAVAGPAPVAARVQAKVVELEKLKSRNVGATVRDPFAKAPVRAAKKKSGAAAPPAQIVAEPPPVPFTYMGKWMSGGDLAVFLVQGERNLVVREGDTIDSLYRVERIGELDISLLYLPLNRRQTFATGAPQ